MGIEYLQVFDKEKNVLNEKIKRENKCNLPNGKYFMVVLIFIENNDGNFLLQKTSKERQSCIATTGGHVSFKDDGLKTVMKEVKEELGLELRAIDVQYVDTLRDNNCFLEIYYTKKDIDINSLLIQESEVEYVEWYSKERILELIKNKEFREGNIDAFKLVLDYRKRNILNNLD